MVQCDGGRFVFLSVARSSDEITIVSGAEKNSCIVVVMLSQGTSAAISFSSYLPPTPSASFSATGFAVSTARDIHPLLHVPQTLRIFLCVKHPRFSLCDIGRVMRNPSNFLSKLNSDVAWLCFVRGGIRLPNQSDQTCSLVTPSSSQKMHLPGGFCCRLPIER
jgi:hypothetical protein